ncbi:MAG: T9SS type A sorting domain-containing protein, partial [Flavobacteriales bacterium]
MSTTTATFTIEDTTNPSIDTAADDETVECDGAGNTAALNAWLADNGGAEASDACGGVTWSNNYTALSDDCGATGSAMVTFTATDDCGNMSTTTATFTIEDTTDPTLNITGPADVSVSQNATCDLDVSVESLGGINYTAEDGCGDVDVEVTHEDSELVYTCDCEEESDEYSFDACRLIPGDFRTQTMGGWGQDNCNGDNPACYRDANFDNAFPTGVTIGCATGYTLTFTSSEAVAIFLPCGGPPSVLSASATDPGCVSNVLAGQLLTAKLSLGFDAADPDFGSAPVPATTLVIDQGAYEGYTIAEVVDLADAVLGGCDVASASNLSDALALFNEGFIGGDSYTDGNLRIDDCEIVTPDPCDGSQEGSYTFTRTFSVVATDDCGNDVSQTYDQTITVTDDMAPVFTEDCGYDNGGVETVCCESLDGTVTLPEACDVTADDNCDTEVEVSFTESYSGDYAPQGSVESYCLASTPEAFAEGEACNGLEPHSFSLFNFDGEDRVDFVAVSEGIVEQTEAGLWSMTQTVTRLDGGDGGFVINVTYGAAMDWDTWSNQAYPTDYKRDCAELVDDHLNWDYRILQSGHILGTGDYEDITLDLSHAPMNLYYAFQVGLGANNQNDNYGYSGWISAHGEIDGDDVWFSGDLFGDLDCCLPWSVTRSYTATDDCGNENAFSYTIEVNSEDCEDGDDANLSGGQSGDHTPVILGGAGDLTSGKTPIRVTNLQPNPANDWSLLGFEVTGNMRIRIDLVTMQGVMVAELYDGVASPNVNHTLNIDTESLSNGMYQIRLSSSQYLVVKKLLVT